MSLDLRNKWWTPAFAASIALPLGIASAEDTPDAASDSQPDAAQIQQDPAAENPPQAPPNTVLRQNQQNTPPQNAQAEKQAIHQQGERKTLRGSLMTLEQFIQGAGADGGTPAQSSGPYALQSDEYGLVILSGDAARMWRGPKSLADSQQKQDNDDHPLGIESRRPAQEEAEVKARQQQEQLAQDDDKQGTQPQRQQSRQQASKDAPASGGVTLESSDPNANFRIVSDAGRDNASARNWRLNRNERSTELQTEDASETYAIERREVSSAESQLPGQVLGQQVMVSGKVYEREGVRFLKVDSIQLDDDSSQPNTD